MLSSAAAAFLVATAAADPEPGRSAPASAPAAPFDSADVAAAAVARCNVRQSNQAIRKNTVSPVFPVISTARRICIARIMLSQRVCPTVCPSQAGIVSKHYQSSKH